MSRIIIGLTGAFGSGTTFLADNFFVPKEYIKLSLSSALKDLYKKKYGKPHSNRSELQTFGNEIREKKIDQLAEIVNEEIKKHPESNFVIDSIRNPAEVNFFRKIYPEFILIGVFADYNVRWNRVRESYSNSKDTFDVDEQKRSRKVRTQIRSEYFSVFF